MVFEVKSDVIIVIYQEGFLGGIGQSVVVGGWEFGQGVVVIVQVKCVKDLFGSSRDREKRVDGEIF